MYFELDHSARSIPEACGIEVSMSGTPINLSLQDYLLRNKSQENAYPCFNCLKGHSITPEMRFRMVDWMTEVLTRCNCSGTTFFLSVHLMEKYLKFGPQGLSADKLHLVGLISMFIASKFEDIEAITLALLQKGICHGKYTEVQLKNMEIEMLIVLKFELKVTLSCDFLGYLAAALDPPAVVKRTAEIILILNKLEYNNYYLPCEEATAALLIAAQSLKQSGLVEDILRVSDYCEEELEISVISMRNLIYEYKLKPPRTKAAMRELGFSFASVELGCFFRFADGSLQASQEQLMSLF